MEISWHTQTKILIITLCKKIMTIVVLFGVNKNKIVIFCEIPYFILLEKEVNLLIILSSIKKTNNMYTISFCINFSPEEGCRMDWLEWKQPNINDFTCWLVDWSVDILWQIDLVRYLMPNPVLYIYIYIYSLEANSLLVTLFLNKLLDQQLNVFKYSYLTLIILFNICHLLIHS